MVRNRGSTTSSTPVPTPVLPRRSSRKGRGAGGRDTQLDQLTDILVAPTRQWKRPFVPDDLDSLPVNPRAPAPKKKRTRRKKVCQCIGQPLVALTDTNQTPATPPLEDAPQPRSQSQLPLPSQPPIDPRFGFFPPQSQPPRTQPVMRSPTPSPTPAPSSPPHSSPTINTTPPGPQNTSDAEISQDDEEGEGSDEEMEIDETSEGEEDRRAHEILQAVPDQTETMRGNSLVRLPYDNRNFAVRFSVHE